MNHTLLIATSGLALFLWSSINFLVFMANSKVVCRLEILKEEIEFLLAENKRTLELIRIQNMEKAYLN